MYFFVFISSCLCCVCFRIATNKPVWHLCDSAAFTSVFQLQSRFEQLKRLHADEKSALEEKKRLLDDDQSSFGKRRAAAQLLQAQSLTANGKKDKDRKK